MNWFDRIARAKHVGFFSDDDKNKADVWTTCACGEQDPKIPRLPGLLCPLDFELRSLGTRLSRGVQSDAINDAGIVLQQIERRSGEILAKARKQEQDADEA
jgi:hypothetical protein